MVKKIFMFFLLIILPYSIFADGQLQTKIDLCKAISDKNQRLECYDAIFDVKPRVVENVNKGKWIILEETSPIDDSKTVVLSLKADNLIHVKYDTKKPSLFIRCKEKKTEVFVDFDVYLGMDTLHPITRIDSEKAISNIPWSISSDNLAIFYAESSKKVISFVKSLVDKNKFFVQVTPYGESPVNTTFDLTGLDEAIKPLKAACDWK